MTNAITEFNFSELNWAKNSLKGQNLETSAALLNSDMNLPPAPNAGGAGLLKVPQFWRTLGVAKDCQRSSSYSHSATPKQVS